MKIIDNRWKICYNDKNFEYVKDFALEILFEDKHVICCIKPAGVLSQEGEGASMPNMLREANGRDVYVVHRLDKEVSGLMVFAKTPEAAASLSEQIVSGAFEKEYLAIAEGELLRGGIMEDMLFFDRKRNKSFVVDRQRSGVKSAKLSFEPIESVTLDEKTYTLVNVRLYTGRTHQIRVQFSSRKAPLVGDRRYGGSKNDGGIALFSRRVSFEHPYTKNKMTFEALPDKAGAWLLFPEIKTSVKEIEK